MRLERDTAPGTAAETRVSANTTESDCNGERDGEWSLRAALDGDADSSYAGHVGPERYPYEDVAWAFIWAASKRDLSISQELRAMADLFETVTDRARTDEQRFESGREAWLALGRLIEITEGGTDNIRPMLTDEERAEVEGLVSAEPLHVGRMAAIRVSDLDVEEPGDYEFVGPDGEIMGQVTMR